MVEQPAVRRGRGRPPAVDQRQIVATARSLGPGLTMHALARELGVDRKTLSNHVTNRRGLLDLVASDVFHEAMAHIDLTGAQAWPEVVRAFGHGLRRGFLAADTPSERFPTSWVSGPASLATTESLLRALDLAGFDGDDGVRALVLITEVAYSSARDATLAQRGNHRLSQVQEALRHAPPEQLGAVRRAVRLRARGPGDEQFDFDLDVLIAGLCSRLRSPTGPDAP